MDDRQSPGPVEDVPRPPVRRDWRDTLRAASDLALTGIVMTLAALPVITAGAAVGTASAAVARWTDQERFPGVRETARHFRHGLLPGIPPLLVLIAFGVLIRLNVHALSVGLAPGGPPLIWATLALAVAGAGFAAMVVVEFGRAGAGWRAATRDAARLAVSRPALPAASAGIMAFTIALGYLIQVILVPILAGYTLLALHVVRRRLGGVAASVRTVEGS
ncbi:hypothetical protein [Catenuloplanes atrovinosus]|uniref:DUF624 domain-containing protein n=1 Tax=Catenuloplanes atrovinosus TaxID=137266 RepID=A0AAE3YX11_9ACTN|nr:hypothetical protein [Catenuloplanes atrovinosus]MDR7280352.1 hypothetical protein [Catenuloplanes atrovinosus]